MIVGTIGSPFLWSLFLLVVLGLLALDLGVFHRRIHAVAFKEAAVWSCFWVALSLGFNLWIWWRFGPQPGLEFLTGYLIEKALSVDNIFVFLVIFRYFSVPAELQHRVLFWGVLGAIVLRAVFILTGAALIARFDWILYLFGAFLLFAGVKILRHDEPDVHPERNALVRLFRRLVPITPTYQGQAFFVRVDGKPTATLLMLVLVVVEATDVVFAVDSIPAIFGVTRDPFIVFTSNILAILGLRALYFLLANLVDRFRYLNVGLGLVLVFVGLKMVLADLYHVPTKVSLGIVCALLSTSVVLSWLLPTKRD